MSDKAHVCSTSLTSCRCLALLRWPLRGGATFRPRSSSPVAERANKPIEIANPTSRQHARPLSPILPTQTSKHVTACQAVWLWLLLWFEAFEESPCRRWSPGSSCSVTGALNPASFLCTSAFRFSCDDSCYLTRRCLCFITPSWLKQRGNVVAGFWCVFLSSLTAEGQAQVVGDIRWFAAKTSINKHLSDFFKHPNVSKWTFYGVRWRARFILMTRRETCAVKGHFGVDGAAARTLTFSLQFQGSTKRSHLPRPDMAKPCGTSET